LSCYGLSENKIVIDKDKDNFCLIPYSNLEYVNRWLIKGLSHELINRADVRTTEMLTERSF